MAKVRTVVAEVDGCLTVGEIEITESTLDESGVLRVRSASGQVKWFSPSGWLSVERTEDEMAAQATDIIKELSAAEQRAATTA